MPIFIETKNHVHLKGVSLLHNDFRFPKGLQRDSKGTPKGLQRDWRCGVAALLGVNDEHEYRLPTPITDSDDVD